MRSALATVANRRAQRGRSGSNLSAIPPSQHTNDYLPELAAAAASIVYQSPLPSPQGHPIFIINAAALPDTFDIDYDSLLPYVLARLPGEDDLITGTEYEIIFFAGGQPEGATSEKKQGPGMGWYLQAYHILSRAMRKRLQRLYIVHPRTWVRVLISLFSTVVSPKFRRKIIHIGNLTTLQQHMPIEDLLIPATALLHDRKLGLEAQPVTARAFGVAQPFPYNPDTHEPRLPRILRETTTFLLMSTNITTEGLFRIPPHSLFASILHNAYDRGQQYLVWKEPNAAFSQPNIDSKLLGEIRLVEAYGVHLAAALIKSWYRELRDPIFPHASYEYLQEKYDDSTQQQIGIDDLVALLDPRSALSVLTNTSRMILTRHLLPMLSTITTHQQQNKMNAQNLAICFAITLIRGPNQLEDVKMASTVQKLLTAAIEAWPHIRSAMGISEAAFWEGLRAPASLAEYEDPLTSGNRWSTVPQLSGQQVSLTEDVPPQNEAQVVTEDVACQDGGSRTKMTKLNQELVSQMQQIPRLLQKLPVKVPPIMARTVPTPEVVKPTPPAVPKRKPARSITSPNETPPLISESPRCSRAIDKEQDAAPSTETLVPTPPLLMPKRKALSIEPEQEVEATVAKPLDDNAHDTIFRKPSWPASARRPSDNITSLAKPVLPGARTQSPIVVTGNLGIPGLPKPRAPSPGLLQRMNSLDSYGSAMDKAGSPDEEKNYMLTPGKLSLKKASVDDLRRLYEERLDTMYGLSKVDMIKRSNSQS